MLKLPPAQSGYLISAGMHVTGALRAVALLCGSEAPDFKLYCS
jgi:hypothetical protein